MKRSFIRQSTQGPYKIDFEIRGKILQTVIDHQTTDELSCLIHVSHCHRVSAFNDNQVFIFPSR